MTKDTEAFSLVPTGRGSFVRAGEVSLVELLRRYDLAHPEHTIMSREAVIAAYREKQEEPE